MSQKGFGSLLGSLILDLAWTHYTARYAERHLSEVKELAAFILTTFQGAAPEANLKVWYHTQRRMGFPPGMFGERTICWETPIGFTVYLDDRALVGMGIELWPTRIVIRQLQGIKGVKCPFELREWPHLFVSATLSYTLARGLKEVRISCAYEQISYDYPSTPHLEHTHEYERFLTEHRKRLEQRYDGTARSLGFTQKHRYWLWENA